MRMAIDVKDRKEGDAIKTALADPETRAFVVVVGILKPLSDGGRRRALNFVLDQLEEDRLRKEQEPKSDR